MSKETVREAVAAWCDTIERRDFAELASLAASNCTIDGTAYDTSAIAVRYERMTGSAHIQPMYNLDRAAVLVSKKRAQVGPVYEITFHHSMELHFTLVATDDEPKRWLVERIESRERGPIERAIPGLGEDYAAMTEAWADANIRWIGRTLAENPPDVAGYRAQTLRRHAVSALDEVLHLRSAPYLATVQRFIRLQAEKMIHEIRTDTVESGCHVWKPYDHGWIVRTREHCWAHDFTEGYGAAVMTDEQIDAVVGEIEALFVSHWHRDHASPTVFRKALEAGVPVYIAPMWEGSEVPAEFTDRPNFHVLDVNRWSMPGQSGTTPSGIQWRALPGHQDHRPNAMFLVEADGFVVLQSGDQYNEDDCAWIDRLGEDLAAEGVRVDLLLTWLPQLQQIPRGVNPRYVIPGHENELGHMFEHREPYDQSYEKLVGIDIPSYVLAWGERVCLS